MSAFRRTLVALLLVAVTLPALAQRHAPEAELKAAILANMLLFVDWPARGAQAADRLTVCYLDGGPLVAALDQLDGKLIKGKPLRVLRVDAAQLAACHALYVGRGDAARLPNLVAALRAGGVLVVGDAAGYLQRGAMLNLEIDGGRVVFDVDLRAVRQAGLAISSKVLRLARQVLDE
jgi:hypothetical protein